MSTSRRGRTLLGSAFLLMVYFMALMTQDMHAMTGYIGDCLQHRPNNVGRSLVDASKGRGVAVIEIATAGQRCLCHPIDIRSRVKALDLGSCCHRRLSNAAASLQSELMESLDKRCIAQWSKWMIGAQVIVA